MGDMVGEETRMWSELQGGRCAGSRAQAFFQLLFSSSETEYGRRPSQSCVDFDLIIGEINFFPFPCQQFCSLYT